MQFFLNSMNFPGFPWFPDYYEPRIIRRLYHYLPRKALIQIYNSFIPAHKFEHDSLGIIHPITLCFCGSVGIESVDHYLFHCPNHAACRSVLFETLRKCISIVTLTSLKYTSDIFIYSGHMIFTLAKP